MQRREFVMQLATALQPAASKGAEPTIIVAFDQDAFPTQYSRDRTCAGVYPGIVSSLFRDAQIRGLYEPLPFKRVIAGYLSGAMAAGAVVRTPERLAAGLYTRPYFVERLRPYFRRGQQGSARSIADLKGLRVGVIRGWAYGAEFDDARAAGAFRVEEVGTSHQNFFKLRRGWLDCVIETELAAALLIPRLKARDDVVAGDFLVIQAPIHLAIPRSVEGVEHRIAALDRAIVAMTSSGALQRLIDQELRAADAYLSDWMREHKLGAEQ